MDFTQLEDATSLPLIPTPIGGFSSPTSIGLSLIPTTSGALLISRSTIPISQWFKLGLCSTAKSTRGESVIQITDSQTTTNSPLLFVAFAKPWVASPKLLFVCIIGGVLFALPEVDIVTDSAEAPDTDSIGSVAFPAAAISVSGDDGGFVEEAVVTTDELLLLLTGTVDEAAPAIRMYEIGGPLPLLVLLLLLLLLLLLMLLFITVLAEVQPLLLRMILLFVETGLFIELLLFEEDDDDDSDTAAAEEEDIVEVADVVLLLLLLLQVVVAVVAADTAILLLLALLLL